MKHRPSDLLLIALVCTVASLTSSNAEVKGQTLPDDHRQGTHRGHGHGNLQKPASLENELRELRKSINKNRQNIESLQHRDGQPEVTNEDADDELTEVRPLDIPLHHHEPDDVADYRLYATTTIRSLDADIPSYEDSDEDTDEDSDDDTEHSGESPKQVEDNIEQQKRSHVKEASESERGAADDDDDDDEDEDNDDDDDDDDEGEMDEARKKKNDGAIILEESRDKQGDDDAPGSVETSTIRPSARDELVRDLNVFLGTSDGATHKEALFEGVAKLKQIRELEKRVALPLKEKYVNAVDPKADEDLLELMVKIAENPREWQNVHGVLQQLEEDLIVAHDVANNVDKMEQKRRNDENSAKARHKPTKLTKEERKLQQEEKKKKKKQKQKEKERLEKERQSKAQVKEKSPEELRREQLERAGLLAPAAPLMKSKQKGGQAFTTKTVTTSTTQSPPVTVRPKATTYLQRERNKGQGSQMKTVDSVPGYSSKAQPRILLHEGESSPRPKSPMQELREKWPKSLSGNEKNPTTAKSIVHGRLRSHEPNNRVRFAGTSKGQQDSFDHTNNWSKSNIASESNEDKDRARARFLKEAIDLKSTGNRWKPNARSKWLETAPLPAKEQRADPNSYFNPSYDQPNNAWPDFSVDSLKHGNLNQAAKTWPGVSMVQNNWPQLPVDPDPDEDTVKWPNFSVTPLGSSKSTHWGRYSSQLGPTSTNNRESATNTWPNAPQQKSPTLVDHSKEVSNSVNNKPWPHFAYHRVTSSPQSLARQQKEAQQRERHRNAYIAVSIIAPPGKNHAVNATSKPPSVERFNHSRKPPLQDKIDDVLEERGQKLIQLDPLEEQLIDMAAYGTSDSRKFSWNHSKHLDKLKEQLRTLSAMEEKLRLQWLEKERLRQILNDASKRGATYYREHRDASPSVHQLSATDSPNAATTADTTHS